MLQTRRSLLREISEVGPRALAWASKRECQARSVLSLCLLGKSALDELPLCEAQRVALCILRRIQQVAPKSNLSVLAGAGLALRQSNSLFKTFEVIETAEPKATPVALVAILGSRLPAQEGRALLVYLAALPRLDQKSRMLAQEGQSLNLRLVFDALRGQLPERLSSKCSAALREDLLELHLMLQERPSAKPKAVSWWAKLPSWKPALRLQAAYS